MPITAIQTFPVPKFQNADLAKLFCNTRQEVKGFVLILSHSVMIWCCLKVGKRNELEKKSVAEWNLMITFYVSSRGMVRRLWIGGGPGA